MRVWKAFPFSSIWTLSERIILLTQGRCDIKYDVELHCTFMCTTAHEVRCWYRWVRSDISQIYSWLFIDYSFYENPCDLQRDLPQSSVTSSPTALLQVILNPFQLKKTHLDQVLPANVPPSTFFVTHTWLIMWCKMQNIAQIYTHLQSQSSLSSSYLTAAKQTDELSQQTCKSPQFSHLRSVLQQTSAFLTCCQHKCTKSILHSGTARID